MTEIELNEDQITAILTEGMARGLYESLNGALPDDLNVRSGDAHELVDLAKTAFANGNRSDNVQTILFIAQTDQKPLPVKEQAIAESVANNDTVIYDKPPAETAPESTVHNGIDLSSLSDGVIEGLITGLDKYPPSEQVEEDRKAYLAEKERRNEKGDKIQDDSQGTTAQEAGEKAGEAAPEGAHPQPAMDDQKSSEAGTDGGSGKVSELSSAQGEDAGAFARAQTPETSPEGKKTKAKPVEEDGSRSALEAQLTLPIVKAHGVDITKLESIPAVQIEFMLENPDGPPKEEKNMAVSEREIEDSVKPKDEKAVAGVVLDNDTPERIISKADLGIEIDESSGENSSDNFDRESLEAQLTGPTLKAYGQGRKNIPNIGINELKFMIDNPDGKVDASELEKAKALDNPNIVQADAVVKSSGLAGPDPLSEDAEQVEDRTLTTAAFEAVAKSPPIEEVSNSTTEDIDAAEESHEKGNTDPADKVFSEIDHEDQQKNRAMEIISREGMPIPPAYSDEEAPILPMDLSLCSRDELFSYHARFHAYESRMLWIMCQEEDTLGDIEKLRKNREAVVAAEVPFMGEDGKRNTNEFRDSQVAADKEVLDLGIQEHEIKKVVKRLKVLCDMYHRSCERLSRQMSKYEREMSDAPR